MRSRREKIRVAKTPKYSQMGVIRWLIEQYLVRCEELDGFGRPAIEQIGSCV